MRIFTCIVLSFFIFGTQAAAECSGPTGLGPAQWTCDYITQPGSVRTTSCGASHGSTRLEVTAYDSNGGTVEPGDEIVFTLRLYNMDSGNYGHYFRSCTPGRMQDLIILRGPFNWGMGQCSAGDLSNSDRMLVGMSGWSPCENPVWMEYLYVVKMGTPPGTKIRVVNQYIRTHNPYSMVIEQGTTITVGKRLTPLIYE